MKLVKVLLTTAAIIMAAGVYAQKANRSDVCQNIPNLTKEQKQKINKQSLEHQKAMDGLRTQFYAENDAIKASEIKKQMNTEMTRHYQEISGLLTPEQQIWYNQQCFATGRKGYGRGQGFGRGQGYGRGMGRFTYQPDLSKSK